MPAPRRKDPQAAADFGLRPRRAVARPGMPVAQESQRSASFAPRRASENERRIVAPFPSSTSRPHLSQTRTVLRANFHSFVLGIWKPQPIRKHE